MTQILTATEKDFSIIRAIAFKTWPITFGSILSEEQIEYMLEMMYSIDALKEQVNEKKHCFLLFKSGDEYLGYASYELNYKGQSKTKIHKIYVLPEGQGKGVGRQLMDKVKDIAVKNSNHKLSLNVNRDNNAIQFYQNIGFTKVGEEDIEIGKGFVMEDAIMEKDIT